MAGQLGLELLRKLWSWSKTEVWVQFLCNVKEGRFGGQGGKRRGGRLSVFDQHDKFGILDRTVADERSDSFVLIVMTGDGDLSGTGLAGDFVSMRNNAPSLAVFDGLLQHGSESGGGFWLYDLPHGFGRKVDVATAVDDLRDKARLHHDTTIGESAVHLDHLERRQRESLAETHGGKIDWRDVASGVIEDSGLLSLNVDVATDAEGLGVFVKSFFADTLGDPGSTNVVGMLEDGSHTLCPGSEVFVVPGLDVVIGDVVGFVAYRTNGSGCDFAGIESNSHGDAFEGRAGFVSVRGYAIGVGILVEE